MRSRLLSPVLAALPVRGRVVVPLAVLTALLVSCTGTPRDGRTSDGGTAGPVGATGAGATTAGATASGAATAGGARAPAREIWIDSVIAGNPVIVHGHARTFENTVQVRVRDARGAPVTEVYTTSAGEMGHHNPFSVRAWLTRAPGSRVIVEAFEYSAKDGSVRSLVADTIEYTVANRTFTLHFPTSECTTTVAIRRVAPRTVAVARLMAEALVAGPLPGERAAGGSAVFPAGSQVREVTLRDGTLTVDFNERLQNVGGACAAQAIRTSVTRTLGAIAGVRRVVITAGGSAELALQP